MRLLMSLVLVPIVVIPAFGGDVPFAERTPSTSRSQQDLHASSLGELMTLAQLRHIKLWYAGQARNKDLALYTLGQMGDTFSNAAMLYQNIPIGLVTSLDQPMRDLRQAINHHDEIAFKRGYSDLTNACNACHRAANLGFISIQTPTSSPFSDQAFDVGK